MTQIRVMLTEDYDAVRALWQSTPGMGINGYNDSREGIASYLRRNPTTCFVAIDGEDLLGAVLSGHDGRRGFIYHLAVREGSRGLGIGRALVAAALNALRAEKINKVALLVLEGNGSGNAFWEALGFKKRSDVGYRDKVIMD